MEEKRNFFRIKNTGSIKAKYEKHDLYVIDISPSGAHVLAKDLSIKKDGVIDIFINHFAVKINYKLLKKDGEKNIVSFQREEEINSLLSALKNIRNSMENNPELTHISSLIPETIVEFKEKLVVPSMEDFTKLNSIYAIRLYQLAQQYLQAGSGVIELNHLHAALGIKHLKSYASWSTFRRNILEPAKQEINEKTDITLIYTEIKDKRKVVAIKLTIMSIIP